MPQHLASTSRRGTFDLPISGGGSKHTEDGLIADDASCQLCNRFPLKSYPSNSTRPASSKCRTGLRQYHCAVGSLFLRLRGAASVSVFDPLSQGSASS